MPTKECDLVVVGGGPAGLCAAIHGSSEGLSTSIIDSKSGLGGQAKQSSLIENYPGFPKGITGQDLMGRFTEQAEKFGTNILCPTVVTTLSTEKERRIVSTDEGEVISAKAVILACGLSYKRLDAKHVPIYLGRGVFYGPSSIDPAKHRSIGIVGGANSGGQAALNAAKNPDCIVRLLVRGDSIETSMSEYLVERIAQAPNIEVLYNTEVAEVQGDNGYLSKLVLRTAKGPKEVPTDLLQIFIGGSPKTLWLNGAVHRDEKGFVLTGSRVPVERWPIKREPLGFETSMPGVFAAGDVRLNFTKRIAAAAGEGSVAIQMVHSYLQSFHGRDTAK